jgi:hypothetical protein
MHIRRIGANCIAFDDSIDEIIAHGATFREGKIRQNSVGVTFPEGSRCMTTNLNTTMTNIAIHRYSQRISWCRGVSHTPATNPDVTTIITVVHRVVQRAATWGEYANPPYSNGIDASGVGAAGRAVAAM